MAAAAARKTSTIVYFNAGAVTATKPVENDEQRRAPRRRTLKAGIAAYADRRCTVGCTVRDISATGARLKSEGSVNIPDTFVLIIELDGLEAACEVVWRRGTELGVRFVGAPRKVEPSRQQVIGQTAPRPPSLRRKPLPERN